MYYITLHNLKSTQEEDCERNKQIIQTITRRLIQIQSSTSINLIHTTITDLVNHTQPLISSTINALPTEDQINKKRIRKPNINKVNILSVTQHRIG
jgi:hypothetical protein